MEAQIVVADPDGRGSVTLWLAPDFCLRLWRWTVYLHSFLNKSKGILAPKVFALALSLSDKLGLILVSPILEKDFSQGINLGISSYLSTSPL